VTSDKSILDSQKKASSLYLTFEPEVILLLNIILALIRIIVAFLDLFFAGFNYLNDSEQLILRNLI